MLQGGNFESPSVRKLINPVCDVDQPTHLNVMESNANFTVYNQVADSVSSSSLTFNVVVPNNTLVGRSFLVSMPFTLTIDTTNGGAGLAYQANYDALRCMPLNQMISTAQLTLNGATTSVQVSNIIYGAWQMMTDAEKAYYSVSGYQDAFHTFTGTTPSIASSLGSYASGANTSEVLPRGAYNSNFTISGTTLTNTQAIISGTIYETLWLLSPLTSGSQSENSKAFAGVNTLNLTLNITSDPARFWCHIPGTNAGTYLSTSNLAIGANTTLTLKYYAPSTPIDTTIQRLYSYQNYVSYTANGGSVASLASVTVASSTISVDATPSKLLVWCRQADAVRTISTADTFLVPQSLSVTYGSRSNLLTTLNQYSLYEMSRKNGLRVSFEKWSQQTGGILIIDVGSDLGTSDLEVPGSLGRQQFSVQATFKNASGNTITNVQMFVVPVIPGALMLGAGSAAFAVGLLSPDQMRSAKAQSNSAAYIKTEQQNDLFGGGLLSDIWDGVKSFGSTAIGAVAPLAANLLMKKAFGGAQVGGAQLGGAIGGRVRVKSPKRAKTPKRTKRYSMKGCGVDDTETVTPSMLEQRLQLESDSE